MTVKEFTNTSGAPAQATKEMPRRAFLLKLGFLLNGVAAAMVSVPLLGYLL